jgi:phosphoribosylformylglycinamidine cyclo-ligase
MSEYSRAGVDISAADKAKSMMKKLVEATYNSAVVGAHGGFGGMYSLKELTGTNKILVGSADGVGTKLKLAFTTGNHKTVGQDLVNHCVNDILCCGARPLFFFDYLGMGRLKPETVADIVGGLAKACGDNEAVLLGGETAELPGFYNDNEYDLAGFIVGWVDKDHIIDGSRIKAGDKIIGLASSGLHTNGYSLARKAFFEIAGMKQGDIIPETKTGVYAELMKVHRSYLPVVSPLMDRGAIRGIVHITGGGFEGNIKRIMPEGIAAVIDTSKWQAPGIFKAIARIASVSDKEMYQVFNMGVGMVLFCDPERAPAIIKQANSENIDAFEIGYCEPGNQKVVIKF